MYKIGLISLVLMLFFFVSGCENSFQLENPDKFDLSTKEGRQKYCEKELVAKYGNDYDVEWDSDGEYVGGFIIGGLLYMGSNHYDLECQGNENTVEIQLNPIEKLEYESVYE